MCGFLIGLATVFVVGGLARWVMWGRRHGCGGGYGGGHGCGGGRGWRGRHGRGGERSFVGSEPFARAAGEVFKRRLDIDEDQEIIVDHALTDLRKALNELGAELKDSRAALGEAFRGEKIDDGALAAAFARHDDALGRARREVLSTLKQVHAVLRPEQRAKAADWIAAGDPRWV